MGAIRMFSSILLVAAVSGCEFGSAPPVNSCSEVPQCDTTGTNPDPLHTCSASWDAHDCVILAEAQKANEPDPMIFKAQVALESNFNLFAISPDSPCGL